MPIHTHAPSLLWLGSWKHILATPRRGKQTTKVPLHFVFCLLYWCFCWFYETGVQMLALLCHIWSRLLYREGFLGAPYHSPLSWERVFPLSLPTYLIHKVVESTAFYFWIPTIWDGKDIWACLRKMTGHNHSTPGCVCWEEGCISKSASVLPLPWC